MLLLSARICVRVLARRQRTASNRSVPGRKHSAADKRLGFIGVGHISWVAGAALFTAAVVGGSGYVIRELNRQIGVACEVVGLPAPAPSITITPEMLDISSIALGSVPVAVINGAPITEGTTLMVQTSEGTALLRVTAIRDGTVQFKYGGQPFSANLRQAVLRKGAGK